MNNKTGSVKVKLLIAISLMIAISYVVIEYYNLSNAYNNNFNNLKDKEIELSIETSKYLDEYLFSKVHIIESVAKQIGYIDQDQNREALRKLLIVGKDAGGFGSVYIGYENNGLMARWNGRDTQPPKDSYDPRTRPWYQSAKSSQKSGTTKTYIDNATKKLTISVYAPVFTDGVFIGAVASDIFLDTIVKTVLNVNIPEYGNAYLVDESGKILIHKNQKLVNTQSKAFKNTNNKKSGFDILELDGADKLISFSLVESTNWYLIIELDKNKAFEKIDKELLVSVILSILFLCSTIVILYILLTKMLKPLKDVESGIIDFFEYLKGNSSGIQKININSNDEFGSMAHEVNKGIDAVRLTLDNDKKVIENVTHVVNQVISGSLTNRINSSTNNKAVQELVNVLNHMIQNLEETIKHSLNVLTKYQNNDYRAKTDIKCTAQIKELMDGIDNLGKTICVMLKENKENGELLQSNASTLEVGVANLLKSSNTQAARLEETSASLEDVTLNIRDNMKNVNSMSSYAKEVTSSAKEGEKLAHQTNTSMDEINSQVVAINDSIEVIDQIAFQTNILSLNAAVEAATAGEAGKGFAVVAQEVRNLASRSAEAARKIKDLVQNATAKANDGKDIASKMIEGYASLNGSIEKTMNLIEDVTNASKNQQTQIEQINQTINTIDNQTQANVSVVNDVDTIAIKTSEIAKNIVEDLKTKQF